MSLRSDITGVVLAGGKSTRMGTEKALLPIGGHPMITYVISTLKKIFTEVIVCGADSVRYEFLGVPIVQDIFPGCGPLAGIHSSLAHSKTQPVFVLSCDTPFVPEELVRYILDFSTSLQTRVAFSEGVLQPLCGLYAQECLPIMETDLRRAKYSIVRTLESIEYAAVSIGPNLSFYKQFIFSNVNRPEDYETISKSIRAHHEEI